MSALPDQKPADKVERLEAATDEAVAALRVMFAVPCALILANEFLQHDVEAKVSTGYVRGLKNV